MSAGDLLDIFGSEDPKDSSKPESTAQNSSPALLSLDNFGTGNESSPTEDNLTPKVHHDATVSQGEQFSNHSDLLGLYSHSNEVELSKGSNDGNEAVLDFDMFDQLTSANKPSEIPSNVWLDPLGSFAEQPQMSTLLDELDSTVSNIDLLGGFTQSNVNSEVVEETTDSIFTLDNKGNTQSNASFMNFLEGASALQPQESGAQQEQSVLSVFQQNSTESEMADQNAETTLGVAPAKSILDIFDSSPMGPSVTPSHERANTTVGDLLSPLDVDSTDSCDQQENSVLSPTEDNKQNSLGHGFESGVTLSDEPKLISDTEFTLPGKEDIKFDSGDNSSLLQTMADVSGNAGLILGIEFTSATLQSSTETVSVLSDENVLVSSIANDNTLLQLDSSTSHNVEEDLESNEDSSKTNISIELASVLLHTDFEESLGSTVSRNMPSTGNAEVLTCDTENFDAREEPGQKFGGESILLIADLSNAGELPTVNLTEKDPSSGTQEVEDLLSGKVNASSENQNPLLDFGQHDFIDNGSPETVSDPLITELDKPIKAEQLTAEQFSILTTTESGNNAPAIQVEHKIFASGEDHTTPMALEPLIAVDISHFTQHDNVLVSDIATPTINESMNAEQTGTTDILDYVPEIQKSETELRMSAKTANFEEQTEESMFDAAETSIYPLINVMDAGSQVLDAEISGPGNKGLLANQHSDRHDLLLTAEQPVAKVIVSDEDINRAADNLLQLVYIGAIEELGIQEETLDTEINKLCVNFKEPTETLHMANETFQVLFTPDGHANHEECESQDKSVTHNGERASNSPSNESIVTRGSDSAKGIDPIIALDSAEYVLSGASVSYDGRLVTTNDDVSKQGKDDSNLNIMDEFGSTAAAERDCLASSESKNAVCEPSNTDLLNVNVQGSTDISDDMSDISLIQSSQSIMPKGLSVEISHEQSLLHTKQATLEVKQCNEKEDTVCQSEGNTNTKDAFTENLSIENEVKDLDQIQNTQEGFSEAKNTTDSSEGDDLVKPSVIEGNNFFQISSEVTEKADAVMEDVITVGDASMQSEHKSQVEKTEPLLNAEITELHSAAIESADPEPVISTSTEEHVNSSSHSQILDSAYGEAVDFEEDISDIGDSSTVTESITVTTDPDLNNQIAKDGGPDTVTSFHQDTDDDDEIFDVLSRDGQTELAQAVLHPLEDFDDPKQEGETPITMQETHCDVCLSSSDSSSYSSVEGEYDVNNNFPGSIDEIEMIENLAQGLTAEATVGAAAELGREKLFLPLNIEKSPDNEMKVPLDDDSEIHGNSHQSLPEESHAAGLEVSPCISQDTSEASALLEVAFVNDSQDFSVRASGSETTSYVDQSYNSKLQSFTDNGFNPEPIQLSANQALFGTSGLHDVGLTSEDSFEVTSLIVNQDSSTVTDQIDKSVTPPLIPTRKKKKMKVQDDSDNAFHNDLKPDFTGDELPVLIFEENTQRFNHNEVPDFDEKLSDDNMNSATVEAEKLDLLQNFDMAEETTESTFHVQEYSQLATSVINAGENPANSHETPNLINDSCAPQLGGCTAVNSVTEQKFSRSSDSDQQDSLKTSYPIFETEEPIQSKLDKENDKIVSSNQVDNLELLPEQISKTYEVENPFDGISLSQTSQGTQEAMKQGTANYFVTRGNADANVDSFDNESSSKQADQTDESKIPELNCTESNASELLGDKLPIDNEDMLLGDNQNGDFCKDINVALIIDPGPLGSRNARALDSFISNDEMQVNMGSSAEADNYSQVHNQCSVKVADSELDKDKGNYVTMEKIEGSECESVSSSNGENLIGDKADVFPNTATDGPVENLLDLPEQLRDAATDHDSVLQEIVTLESSIPCLEDPAKNITVSKEGEYLLIRHNKEDTEVVVPASPVSSPKVLNLTERNVFEEAVVSKCSTLVAATDETAQEMANGEPENAEKSTENFKVLQLMNSGLNEGKEAVVSLEYESIGSEKLACIEGKEPAIESTNLFTLSKDAEKVDNLKTQPLNACIDVSQATKHDILSHQVLVPDPSHEINTVHDGNVGTSDEDLSSSLTQEERDNIELMSVETNDEVDDSIATLTEQLLPFNEENSANNSLNDVTFVPPLNEGDASNKVEGELVSMLLSEANNQHSTPKVEEGADSVSISGYSDANVSSSQTTNDNATLQAPINEAWETKEHDEMDLNPEPQDILHLHTSSTDSEEKAQSYPRDLTSSMDEKSSFANNFVASRETIEENEMHLTQDNSKNADVADGIMSDMTTHTANEVIPISSQGDIGFGNSVEILEVSSAKGIGMKGQNDLMVVESEVSGSPTHSPPKLDYIETSENNIPSPIMEFDEDEYFTNNFTSAEVTVSGDLSKQTTSSLTVKTYAATSTNYIPGHSYTAPVPSSVFIDKDMISDNESDEGSVHEITSSSDSEDEKGSGSDDNAFDDQDAYDQDPIMNLIKATRDGVTVGSFPVVSSPFAQSVPNATNFSYQGYDSGWEELVAQGPPNFMNLPVIMEETEPSDAESEVLIPIQFELSEPDDVNMSPLANEKEIVEDSQQEDSPQENDVALAGVIDVSNDLATAEELVETADETSQKERSKEMIDISVVDAAVSAPVSLLPDSVKHDEHDISQKEIESQPNAPCDNSDTDDMISEKSDLVDSSLHTASLNSLGTSLEAPDIVITDVSEESESEIAKEMSENNEESARDSLSSLGMKIPTFEVTNGDAVENVSFHIQSGSDNDKVLPDISTETGNSNRPTSENSHIGESDEALRNDYATSFETNTPTSSGQKEPSGRFNEQVVFETLSTSLADRAMENAFQDISKEEGDISYEIQDFSEKRTSLSPAGEISATALGLNAEMSTTDSEMSIHCTIPDAITSDDDKDTYSYTQSSESHDFPASSVDVLAMSHETGFSHSQTEVNVTGDITLSNSTTAVDSRKSEEARISNSDISVPTEMPTAFTVPPPPPARKKKKKALKVEEALQEPFPSTNVQEPLIEDNNGGSQIENVKFEHSNPSEVIKHAAALSNTEIDNSITFNEGGSEKRVDSIFPVEQVMHVATRNDELINIEPHHPIESEFSPPHIMHSDISSLNVQEQSVEKDQTLSIINEDNVMVAATKATTVAATLELVDGSLSEGGTGTVPKSTTSTENKVQESFHPQSEVGATSKEILTMSSPASEEFFEPAALSDAIVSEVEVSDLPDQPKVNTLGDTAGDDVSFKPVSVFLSDDDLHAASKNEDNYSDDNLSFTDSLSSETEATCYDSLENEEDTKTKEPSDTNSKYSVHDLGEMRSVTDISNFASSEFDSAEIYKMDDGVTESYEALAQSVINQVLAEVIQMEHTDAEDGKIVKIAAVSDTELSVNDSTCSIQDLPQSESVNVEGTDFSCVRLPGDGSDETQVALDEGQQATGDEYDKAVDLLSPSYEMPLKDESTDFPPTKSKRTRYDTTGSMGSIRYLTDSEDEGESPPTKKKAEQLISLDDDAAAEEEEELPPLRSPSMEFPDLEGGDHASGKRKSLVPPSSLVLSVALDDVPVKTSLSDISEATASHKLSFSSSLTGSQTSLASSTDSTGSKRSRLPRLPSLKFKKKQTPTEPMIIKTKLDLVPKEDIIPIVPMPAMNRFVKWENVTVKNIEYRIDETAIQPYKKVVSHGGFYDDKSAIIEIFTSYLPSTNVDHYEWVMDNLFLYVLATVELLAQEKFSVVMFVGSTPKHKIPANSLLKKWHEHVDYRLKKHVEAFYIVNPTLYFRTMAALFVSRKVKKKMKYIKSMGELKSFIPTDFLFVPPEIAK